MQHQQTNTFISVYSFVHFSLSFSSSARARACMCIRCVFQWNHQRGCREARKGTIVGPISAVRLFFAFFPSLGFVFFFSFIFHCRLLPTFSSTFLFVSSSFYLFGRLRSRAQTCVLMCVSLLLYYALSIIFLCVERLSACGTFKSTTNRINARTHTYIQRDAVLGRKRTYEKPSCEVHAFALSTQIERSPPNIIQTNGTPSRSVASSNDRINRYSKRLESENDANASHTRVAFPAEVSSAKDRKFCDTISRSNTQSYRVGIAIEETIIALRDSSISKFIILNRK